MIIEIRPEQKAHFPAVYELYRKAFGQEVESILVNKLRQSDAFIPSLSLVAEINGKVLGHILLTKIKIQAPDGKTIDSLALAPMAVLPEFQNMGIGEQLVWHGLTKAKELGNKSVIVLGHEKYYPRFGFKPASKWGIKAPMEVPDGSFMALELVKGSLEGVSGTVQYAREFGI